MRVDERDDEAEGLRQVGAPQPALGLPRVELVPALAQRAGVAGPEVLGLRVLSGVGRLPVGEPVVASQPIGVGWRPAAQQRAGRPTGGSGATCPCRRPHTRPPGASGRGWECSGCSSGSLPDFGPSWSRPRPNPRIARRRGAPGVRRMSRSVAVTAGRFRGSGRRSAWVWVRVTPCWAGYWPVSSVARLGRAHRRVAERPTEGEPGVRQPLIVRHQIAKPARILGPVARVALLVGDQQQDVGRSRAHGEPFGATRGFTASRCRRFPCSRRAGQACRPGGP